MGTPDMEVGAEAFVTIVGLHGGQWFGREAGDALRRADVLLGARRQLDLLAADISGEKVELWGQLDRLFDVAAARSAAGESVCILASGDPGFFGLVRLATARLGPHRVSVHPAPSSVSLAFARVGVNWDDAVIVSAHGRPLAAAVEAVLHNPKTAVLVSAENSPQALGRALLDRSSPARLVSVCARLGEPDESVWHGDLDGLSAGTWDPLAVVVLRAPRPQPDAMGLAWGLPAAAFAHREGMITKGEVRAVILSKLRPPLAGVLWDIGAGSGSVAVECARLAPGLDVLAIERRADDLARLSANAAGTTVRGIQGEAPAVLASLSDPDRVFVGGGGLEVLDAALARLRPGGVVVAAYATLGRAEAAARRLGQMAQVSVSRGATIGADGAWRLEAENPVFVCWGPAR